MAIIRFHEYVFAPHVLLGNFAMPDFGFDCFNFRRHGISITKQEQNTSDRKNSLQHIDHDQHAGAGFNFETDLEQASLT